jgi:very-short-patch-repair endonuclease
MKLSDFFNNGRVNSAKLKENWILKHDPIFLNDVNSYISRHEISAERFVEKLWYYFNGKTQTVLCKSRECTNRTSFIGLSVGHLNYCSSKCSNASEDIKNKKIESNIKKYGVANPYQSDNIKQKIKNTNIERHGADNPMRSDKIKKKMMERSISETGKKWALSRGGVADLTKRNNNRQKLERKYEGLELLEYSDKKFGVCSFYKKECGHTFEINKWQAHLRKINGTEICTICNPIGSFNSTVWQKELSEFLESEGLIFSQQNRKIISPYELDFYIESRKVAIELNGLYWHSVVHKDQEYHLRKTELCESIGVQLIHIFEDEWLYRKEIVKSRLLSIFGKTKRKIFARKCSIKKLSNRETGIFLSENHIQGNIPAKMNYCLEIDGEIVSVMTFGSLRRALGSTAKDEHYEMYRFCNKKDTQVVGGASKLLNYFIKEHKPISIISYADRRWSIGKLYETLGFRKIKNTSPNFWCVTGSIRQHRFNYTRKKILSKMKADTTTSTDELFDLIGVNKIYDSGNIKFELICLIN